MQIKQLPNRFILCLHDGATLFAFRLLIQTWKPLRVINSSELKIQDDFYFHENDKYALPFSFFNHVLINPKYLKQEEIDEILFHEHVHIRERHWIDLLIIELLTVIFWFNPFIWFIELAIKQNHEYLADQGVIPRGHSPVRYQALTAIQRKMARYSSSSKICPIIQAGTPL